MHNARFGGEPSDTVTYYNIVATVSHRPQKGNRSCAQCTAAGSQLAFDPTVEAGPLYFAIGMVELGLLCVPTHRTHVSSYDLRPLTIIRHKLW